MTEPVPIPIRVALTTCAHILRDRARRIRDRGSNEGAVRRARTAHPATVAHRQDKADELFIAADALLRLAGPQHKYPEYAGVDAAVLGYLCAILAGDGNLLGELRAELVETGWTRTAADTLRCGDLLALCRAILLPGGGG